MKSKLTRLKRKLDKLIQQKYVPLNPDCFVCREPTSEMHHFVQKKQSTYLRYDIRNLIPLCRSCHCKHHIAGDPMIHATIIRKKGFEWVDQIEQDRRKILKLNLGILEEKILEYKREIT